MTPRSSFLARLRRFGRSDDGTATVESVLWLPVFFAFLILVADVSMIFNGQSRMLRAVQDANRSLSVGRIQTTASAEAAIRAAVADLDSNPTVKTVINDGVIRTTLKIPASKLDMIGFFAPLVSASVSVSSEHFVEF